MVQEFKEIYNIHIIIHKGNFPLNPFVNAYKIGQIIRSNQFVSRFLQRLTKTRKR